MDSGILSTISALAGTLIGAVSSLGTTWMSDLSRQRSEKIAAEILKREKVYGRFMDELAMLYAEALKTVGIDYDRLTKAYALNGRITLHGSKEVSDAATNALRYIVDLAIGPPRSPEEMRQLMEQPEADVIGTFAQACRKELERIR